MMLTTDLSLKLYPIYGRSPALHENPDQLADAVARAWYKLCTATWGPVSRYLGPWVPEPQLWQDPVPAVDHELIGGGDIAVLRQISLRGCPSPSWSEPLGRRPLPSVALTTGRCKRGTDSLAPQRDWEVNRPNRNWPKY